MIHRIQSVKAKKDFTLEVGFMDGTVKEYNMKNIFERYPQMRELRNGKLFDTVRSDTGGYGISWTDGLDMDAETIWEDGIFVRKESVGPLLETAARLAEARNCAGITQKQLAEKTGVYQGDISKIERGMSNPSINTLSRLADGMGMKLNLFFAPK